MSFSQFGQDIKCLDFYKNKQNGFFIDIGAHDGITGSNTYLLEKNGWNGICVEPMPENFRTLCLNRKKSLCCDLAIYSSSNEEIMFDIFEMTVLSGISKHIKISEVYNKGKKSIMVKTITFNDLLEKYNAPLVIDYLSLDTEGSEFEILKSVDLTKYIFGLIDVEHNYVEPNRTQIKELLLNNGYEFIETNNVDDRYKHKLLNN
jgi:FkbM family methyltransferase